MKNKAKGGSAKIPRSKKKHKGKPENPMPMGPMTVFEFACGHKVLGITDPGVCPICGVCESCAELNYPEVN